MTLYELVKDAWINAMENDPDYFNGYTDRDIAIDMISYDADIGEYDPDVDEIEVEVAQVRREYPLP